MLSSFKDLQTELLRQLRLDRPWWLEPGQKEGDSSAPSAFRRQVLSLAFKWRKDSGTLLIQKEKSREAMAMVLGAFLAGRPFVILHPEDSPSLAREVGRILGAETAKAAEGEKVEDLPPLALPSGNTAYFALTSGTSGSPKIAALSYENLLAYLNAFLATFPGFRGARMAHTFAPGFDMFVSDILLAALTGSALVPFAPTTAAGSLAGAKKAGITAWFSVPTFASLALSGAGEHAPALPQLRWVFFIGEPLLGTLARRFRALAPGCTIVNLYGPAETTMAVSFHAMGPEEEIPERPPLGRPFPGAEIRLAQDGSIEISGAFVGQGYVGRADPGGFSENSYNTGDRGGWNEKGELVFEGRVRPQIKWKGIRFEQGELESAWERSGAPWPSLFFPLEGNVCVLVAAKPAEDELLVVMRKFSELLPRLGAPAKVFSSEALPLGKTGKADPRKAEEEADSGAYFLLISLS